MKYLILVLFFAFSCTASKIATTVKTVPEDYYKYGKNIIVIENINSDLKHGPNLLICDTTSLKFPFDGEIIVLNKKDFTELSLNIHKNASLINIYNNKYNMYIVYINYNDTRDSFLVPCSAKSSLFFDNIILNVKDKKLKSEINKYYKCK